MMDLRSEVPWPWLAFSLVREASTDSRDDDLKSHCPTVFTGVYGVAEYFYYEGNVYFQLPLKNYDMNLL